MRWEIAFLTNFLLVQLVQADGGDNDAKVVAPTPRPHTYPVITYTCQQNVINSITVKPDQSDNLKVKTNAGYCKRSKDGQPGLLTCIKANMVGGKVQLVYSIDPASDLVAGNDFKYYELLCTEKSEIKNASVSLLKFRPTATTPFWNTLQANLNSGKPELTVSPDQDLQVGQKLTLIMKITGKSYHLSPQECNAHRSTGDTKKIYPIWKCKQPPVDENIINQGIWIINSSSSPSDTSVSISMYAFKFIESTNVVIECSAMVCPEADKNKCNLDLCTTVKRKRRSQKATNTTLNVPIRHASVSLKVRDQIFNSSSVSGLTTRWYAYLVPAFLIIGSRLYV